MMRRRTIADHPLRTATDHQRLDLHRKVARSFRALVDGTSPYPDPTRNHERTTPFALTVAELRAEWARCRAGGWGDWELDERLRPGPLADPSGVRG